MKTLPERAPTLAPIHPAVLLTEADVADLWQCSTRAVRRMTRAGLLVAVYLPGMTG
jgi:hypothetical protein